MRGALPHTHLDDLPPEALVNGQFPSGAGGSIHNFLQQGEDRTFNTALSIIHRQGPDYLPTSYDDQQHGGTYNVNGGSQIGNPNRAEWNFNFDVNTRTDLQKFLLDHDITIDVHRASTNQDVILHAVYDPAHAAGGSPIVFEDSHNNIVINDNGGNEHILANSENVHFGFLFPTYNYGPETFTVDLAITQFEKGNHSDPKVIADIHDTVIVGMASPELHAV